MHLLDRLSALSPVIAALAALTVITMAPACGDSGGGDPTHTTDTATDTGADTATDTGNPTDTGTTECPHDPPTQSTCNPYPTCTTGCDAGLSCTNIIDGTSEDITCVTGTAQLGEGCDLRDGPSCADGLCVNDECRQFCVEGSDCDNGTDCRQYRSGPLVTTVCGGLTNVVCNPLVPDAQCPAGLSCYRDTAANKGACYEPGTGKVGESCDCAECCETGLTCARLTADEPGICGELCVAESAAANGCGPLCEGRVAWRAPGGYNILGVCLSFEAFDITTLPFNTTRNDSLELFGEYDVFQFTGTAGQVVRVTTDTPVPGFSPAGIDTIVSIHNVSDGLMVAINDDGVPRISLDSAVITELPADGDYYVLVRDCLTYRGERAEGDHYCRPAAVPANNTYKLRLTDLSDDVLPTTEPDGSDMPTAVTFPPNGNGFRSVTISGTFEDDADVDVFSFTLASSLSGVSGDHTYRAEVLMHIVPPGTDLAFGSGATVDPRDVRITTAADPTTTIARLNANDEDASIRVPLETEVLHLVHITTPPGVTFDDTRNFYLGVMAAEQSWPVEKDDTANDLPVGAELHEPLQTGDDLDIYLIDGNIGDNGADVDHYTFPIVAPKRIVDLACSATDSGSGLEGLTVTLLRPDGTPIPNAIAKEGATTAAQLIEQDPPFDDASIILKVSALGADASITSNHYTCQLNTRLPTPQE